MGRICGACGRQVPAGFRYCGHCGAPQAAAADIGARADLGAEVAERRQVTVLFCDLVGSTVLAEQLDPEDLRDIMRLYQALCVEVVARFGGKVSGLAGDGLVVYFGHPLAYEDAAERAVRAGLAISEAVGQLQVAARLQVRIGVATGLAIVGDTIETGGLRERELIGPPPHLAARLQALAKPNGVVVSATTRGVAGDIFAYHDLGEHDLPGFAEPVRAFAVVGENIAADRFEARTGGAPPAIVNRESERAFLRARWRHLQDGKGHVVLMSGEPGIGKSRLVRDLRDQISNDAHRRLSYAGSPLHQHTPLYPMAHWLARAARIATFDSAAQRRVKLGALLAPILPDDTDRRLLIEEFVGPPAGPEQSAAAATSERRKARLIQVLVDLIATYVARQRLLVVFEDVQWIDSSTWDLLERLVRRIENLPVLLLVTFRTGVVWPVTAVPYQSKLALAPLDRPSCAGIIQGVSGTRNLPTALIEQIIARTDGVPLFIEELTKAVLESQDETTPFAVPETLRDTLMARLGRGQDARLVAQIAATIGREFPYELLAMLAPMSAAALQSALSELLDSGLIFERGLPPRATYSFKHALVRDVTYDSQLLRQRRRIHYEIAVTLEKHFPETRPEVLGHHFEEAGATAQAIEEYERAARAARGRSANVEAAANFARALQLLESLPAGAERDRKELDLQIAHGAQLVAVKGNAADEVGKAYRRALFLSNQLGETSGVSRVSRGLQTFYIVRGLLAKARPIGERLLAEAGRAPEPDALLQAHRPHGLCLLLMGDLTAARHHLTRALSLYDPARHGQHRFLYGSDPGVLARCNLAWVEWFLGDPKQALEHSAAALRLAEQPEPHAHSQAFAGSLAASLHQFRQEPELALAQADEVIKLADDHNFAYWRAWGHVVRGWACAIAEGSTAGLAKIETGLADYRGTGSGVMCPYFLGLQGETLIRLGRFGDGLAAIEEALELARDGQIGFYEPELYRLKAELLAAIGGAGNEPVACLWRAIELAHRQRARSHELRAAVTLCRQVTDPAEQAPALDRLRTLVGELGQAHESKAMTEARAILDVAGVDW